MPAKNIVKSWKLPCETAPPASDMVKGVARPWWQNFFNRSLKEQRKKCPICLVRMNQVKTGRGDESCADCAHWHYRTSETPDQSGKVRKKSIYLTTQEILDEAARYRKQLFDSRTPGKKNH